MKKILVLDDDADVRRTLSGLLSAEFEVIEVSNGREALRCLAEQHPALAIVDMRMPGMSGLDFLRAAAYLRDGTVFIMLTAEQDAEAAAAALSEGAVVYMTKPWEPEALRGEVRRLLAPAERKNGTGAPWRIKNG